MHNKFLWGLWILMMVSFGLVLITKMTYGENEWFAMPWLFTEDRHQISLSGTSCTEMLIKQVTNGSNSERSRLPGSKHPGILVY